MWLQRILQIHHQSIPLFTLFCLTLGAIAPAHGQPSDQETLTESPLHLSKIVKLDGNLDTLSLVFTYLDQELLTFFMSKFPESVEGHKDLTLKMQELARAQMQSMRKRLRFRKKFGLPKFFWLNAKPLRPIFSEFDGNICCTFEMLRQNPSLLTMEEHSGELTRLYKESLRYRDATVISQLKSRKMNPFILAMYELSMWEKVSKLANEEASRGIWAQSWSHKIWEPSFILACYRPGQGFIGFMSIFPLGLFGYSAASMLTSLCSDTKVDFLGVEKEIWTPCLFVIGIVCVWIQPYINHPHQPWVDIPERVSGLHVPNPWVLHHLGYGALIRRSMFEGGSNEVAAKQKLKTAIRNHLERCYTLSSKGGKLVGIGAEVEANGICQLRKALDAGFKDFSSFTNNAIRAQLAPILRRSSLFSALILNVSMTSQFNFDLFRKDVEALNLSPEEFRSAIQNLRIDLNEALQRDKSSDGLTPHEIELIHFQLRRILELIPLSSE